MFKRYTRIEQLALKLYTTSARKRAEDAAFAVANGNSSPRCEIACCPLEKTTGIEISVKLPKVVDAVSSVDLRSSSTRLISLVTVNWPNSTVQATVYHRTRGASQRCLTIRQEQAGTTDELESARLVSSG